MDAQLKKILEDNNICGFQGETIEQLVRELKSDNLCLMLENRRLKEQLETYKNK